MIRETYRAESIARDRAIAHFINGVSGQSLMNAVTGNLTTSHWWRAILCKNGPHVARGCTAAFASVV